MDEETELTEENSTEAQPDPAEKEEQAALIAELEKKLKRNTYLERGCLAAFIVCAIATLWVFGIGNEVFSESTCLFLEFVFVIADLSFALAAYVYFSRSDTGKEDLDAARVSVDKYRELVEERRKKAEEQQKKLDEEEKKRKEGR